MSEEDFSKLIPITVILGVLIYIQYSFFMSWGLAVKSYIEADQAIDLGDLLFFLTATISLFLSIGILILLMINFFTNREKQSIVKIASLTTAIVLIIFFIQILMGLLVMLDVI